MDEIDTLPENPEMTAINSELDRLSDKVGLHNGFFNTSPEMLSVDGTQYQLYIYPHEPDGPRSDKIYLLRDDKSGAFRVTWGDTQTSVSYSRQLVGQDGGTHIPSDSWHELDSPDDLAAVAKLLHGIGQDTENSNGSSS